jgi:prevent-host-death family protein
MNTIGAAKFKEQCLSLLDNLSPEGIVITKHGKPVARVLPYPQRPERMIGALRDKIAVRGDIFSTGVSWDADAES